MDCRRVGGVEGGREEERMFCRRELEIVRPKLFLISVWFQVLGFVYGFDLRGVSMGVEGKRGTGGKGRTSRRGYEPSCACRSRLHDRLRARPLGPLRVL